MSDRDAKHGRRSAVAVADATARITAWNRRGRRIALKCSAMSRTTGQQCGQVAMANGKCAWHGGKTPSGDQWHLPQWGDGKGKSATAKLNAKLRDRDRAARKRAARLAAMTAEERERHQAWQRSHKPGPGRAARREERRQNREALKVIGRGGRQHAPHHPEIETPPTHLTGRDPEQHQEPTMVEDDDVEVGSGTDEVVRRIRSEGVRVAYEAALEVCRDKKAPAPAKATAAGLIFRAAGLFEAKSLGDERPLEELNAGELAQRAEHGRRVIEELERKMAGRSNSVLQGEPGEAASGEGSVFG